MSDTQKRPNVIWIFGDQHRGQALSCAGDPNLSTPNVDRMAQEGLWMRQAVGGCPLCCPFRGSLLTSRYPHRAVPGHERQMDPNLPTVATAFNEHGYRTAYFGKWHVDGYKEENGRGVHHTVPRERRGGFQDWLGFENNNSQWDTWVHGHSGDHEIPHERLPTFETNALTDRFLDYLTERHKEREWDADGSDPFFAVLSVQPPHDPYYAPEEWMRGHTPANIQFRPNVPDIPRIRDFASRELAGYYAMIENLDWNLGRIRQFLRDANMDDDTHILFFSDHGDMHGSHGQFRKTSPWEEAIRVPCFIGGPANQYFGRTGDCDIPMNHVDYGPTSLGLCGLPVPDWMEGTDWSPYRLGDNLSGSEPDSAYLQLVEPTGHGHSLNVPWRGVVTRDGWKYVCVAGQPLMLHNLNEDPYEQVNHAFNSVYREEHRRLRDRLGQWISDTGDMFMLPPEP